ncbi:MAG: S8 family peptidase, partial [Flavisolibacter sp.]
MVTYTIGGKNGKKIALEESNDRIVVRTKNARSLNDAVFSNQGKETLSNFDVEVEFPEADITVLKSKEEKPVERTVRDNARAVLKAEPELRFAGRVLIDSDSNKPVIYTENIFIKFYDNVTADSCEKILAENQLVIKQKLDYAVNSFFVAAPENIGLEVFDITESLLKRKEVELCHPELIRKKSLKVIHPSQWHLRLTTVNGNQVNANIHADIAHQIAQGDNVTIAIIDDGVDIDHPEFNLPAKVVDSRDITLNMNDPRPKKANNNHGTACAGVAAASGLFVSGVAPKARLMPIRLYSNLGSFAEANAFKWAADHGADIISCSWGPEDGAWFDLSDTTHFVQVDMPDHTRLAIEHAVTNGRNGKGCVIFFAAGNGNEDVKFDGYASSENVIAVAACNDTNTRSVYSDFGDKVWCSFPSNDFGHMPFNHAQPKTRGIYTTDRRGIEGYSTSTDYADNFGGTSSACPGAAGTAALILSVYPELTWKEVREIIKDTCEKIDQANGQYDAQGHSKLYGYGKIDAEKAVKRALALKIGSNKTIKIVAALVDAVGADIGHEKISLKNNT